MCIPSLDAVTAQVAPDHFLGSVWEHLFGSGLQGRGIAAVAGLSEGPCTRPFQLGQARQQLLLLLLRPQQACKVTPVSAWACQIQRRSQELKITRGMSHIVLPSILR